MLVSIWEQLVADVFSAEKRSAVMSRIRSSGTGIERALYLIVRRTIGNRWRIDTNVNHLPGKPDIMIPGLRLIIFCDGCFYHCCPIHRRDPKSNTNYWKEKLQKNAARDRKNRSELRRLGFKVWSLWEHQLEGRRALETERLLQRRLRRVLTKRQATNPAKKH